VLSKGERDELELKLQVSIAPALIATRGYGAPATVEAYERARRLMHSTDEYSEQAGILSGLYAVYITRAEYDKALDLAEEGLKLAEQRADSADLCVTNRLLAVSHTIGGDFEAARDHAQKAWSLYDSERHGRFAWRYGQDIGVAAGSFLTIALCHLGHFDQSAKLARDVLGLAERLEHQNSIGYAHCVAGAFPSLFRRDFPTLQYHSSRMQRFGNQHQLPQWVSLGACLEAPALAAAGEHEKANEKMKMGLVLRDRINNKFSTRLILTGAVEVHMRAGRSREALALIRELLETAGETCERWTNSELWRLRGDTVLAAEGRSGVDDAEACYRQSISIADEQHSYMLQLRAATSLARLMIERGQRNDAYELIYSIFGSFTEGFQIPDLKDAASLLADLS